jgi:hypothetical protein
VLSSNAYLPNPGPNGWLNPAAFANPALGTVTGNLVAYRGDIFTKI